MHHLKSNYSKIRVTDKLSASIGGGKKKRKSCFELNSQLGIFLEFVYHFVWVFKGPIKKKLKLWMMLKQKFKDEQDELLYRYSSSEEPLIHSVVRVHSKEIFYTTLLIHFN